MTNRVGRTSKLTRFVTRVTNRVGVTQRVATWLQLALGLLPQSAEWVRQHGFLPISEWVRQHGFLPFSVWVGKLVLNNVMRSPALFHVSFAFYLSSVQVWKSRVLVLFVCTSTDCSSVELE